MYTVSNSFNFDLCMDLIRLTDAFEDSSEQIVAGDANGFWSVILAVFSEKANKKSFFFGRRVGPTLADVELILRKLQGVKGATDERTWQQMTQVLTYLTHRALNSAEAEIENRSQQAKFELAPQTDNHQGNSGLQSSTIEAKVSETAISVALKRDFDLLKVLQIEE